MINKTYIFTIFIVLTLILAFSFVFAKPNQENGENKTINNYGQCVKNCTTEKNLCFIGAKENFKICKKEAFSSFNNTENSTETDENKTETIGKFLQCIEAYKSEKQECKVKFKECKNSCQEYKCGVNEVFNERKCYRGCYSDADCSKNRVCNAAQICLPPPGCIQNQTCPDVCYGFCVKKEK